MDATLQLSTQTVAWLANHPRTRQFVGSVWDKLALACSPTAAATVNGPW